MPMVLVHLPELRSQILMYPSREPLTKVFALVLTVREVIQSECSVKVSFLCRVSTSVRLMELSSPPERRSCEFCENFNALRDLK